MAKIFIKMFILLGVLLAVPYYMMGGEMPNFMSGMIPSASKAKPQGLKGLGNAVTDQEVKVYQWVDEKGVKHYSSTPPSNQQVDSMTLKPDPNWVKQERIKVAANTDQAKPKKSAVSMGSPYSPGGAKKILDDAMGVQDMLNKRYEQQKKAMGRQ